MDGDLKLTFKPDLSNLSLSLGVTADIPLIAGQVGLGVYCYADDGHLRQGRTF